MADPVTEVVADGAYFSPKFHQNNYANACLLAFRRFLHPYTQSCAFLGINELRSMGWNFGLKSLAIRA